jgi:hypothetical protein
LALAKSLGVDGEGKDRAADERLLNICAEYAADLHERGVHLSTTFGLRISLLFSSIEFSNQLRRTALRPRALDGEIADAICQYAVECGVGIAWVPFIKKFPIKGRE